MFSDDALLFWGVAFGAEVSEVFGHFHLIWTETEIREHQWETSVYFHYVLWMFSVAVSLQSGLSSQEQECVRHSCSKAPKTFKIHYWTLTHIKVHETHREQLSLFLCSGFLFFMSPFLRLSFVSSSRTRRCRRRWRWWWSPCWTSSCKPCCQSWARANRRRR